MPVRQPPHRNHVHKQSEKTTRVRTVLNEKQLHTLRTCYNANPRPDALMKEQLVEMTGLSPRVIRVWFQNKRCKDKKRSIFMKQLQQQQHNDKTVWILTLMTNKISRRFNLNLFHCRLCTLQIKFPQWLQHINPNLILIIVLTVKLLWRLKKVIDVT